MKKRTAFIGAILSLIPFGQPLLIKTGFVLSTTGLVLSVPKRVNAESADSYARNAYQNYQNEKFSDALIDINKAINLESDNFVYYGIRGGIKSKLGDYYGTISDYDKVLLSDYNKSLRLGPEDDYYFHWRGVAKMRIGDIKGACFDWEKASSLGYKDILNLKDDKC